MWHIENLQTKLENNFLFDQLFVKKVDQSNVKALENFISHFDDFFLLCEGIKGNAQGILTACPPSKDIEKDKICLGFFKDQELIAFIDLIKNFPFDDFITIGYFLVIPQKRSSGFGSLLMKNIINWSKDQGFQKLRLGVQSQNKRALTFWQKNDFQIKDSFSEKLEAKENLTYRLEYNI
ncbi:MAG: GNAT family N-acetyltransferase [Janthinobacterium lividum]